MPVPVSFYARDPAIVAKELLGMHIVRVYQGRKLVCRIVEVEAYYGIEDPASRARRGRDLARALYDGVGIAIVYGMHRQWLFNVAAHECNQGGAVLIRACEPIEGIDIMKKLRGIDDVKNLTNGPGKLCRALAIDKSFHWKPVYVEDYGLWIEFGDPIDSSRIARSYRVGVSQDLDIPLRFYIKDSEFVSKPSRVRYGLQRQRSKT